MLGAGGAAGTVGVSGALGLTSGMVSSTMTSVIEQGGNKITLPAQAAELPPLGMVYVCVKDRNFMVEYWNAIINFPFLYSN